MACAIHVGGNLRTHTPTPDDEKPQRALIIGTPNGCPLGLRLYVARIWTRAFSIHVHGGHGARNRTLGGGVPGRASVAGSGCPGAGGRDSGGLFWLGGVRFHPRCRAMPAARMADRGQHSRPTTSHKVLVAVGCQEVCPETVRL